MGAESSCSPPGSSSCSTAVLQDSSSTGSKISAVWCDALIADMCPARVVMHRKSRAPHPLPDEPPNDSCSPTFIRLSSLRINQNTVPLTTSPPPPPPLPPPIPPPPPLRLTWWRLGLSHPWATSGCAGRPDSSEVVAAHPQPGRRSKLRAVLQLDNTWPEQCCATISGASTDP